MGARVLLLPDLLVQLVLFESRLRVRGELSQLVERDRWLSSQLWIGPVTLLEVLPLGPVGLDGGSMWVGNRGNDFCHLTTPSQHGCSSQGRLPAPQALRCE